MSPINLRKAKTIRMPGSPRLSTFNSVTERKASKEEVHIAPDVEIRTPTGPASRVGKVKTLTKNQSSILKNQGSGLNSQQDALSKTLRVPPKNLNATFAGKDEKPTPIQSSQRKEIQKG